MGNRFLVILILTVVYTASLVLSSLALGLIQGAVTGHRFVDDDVGAAMVLGLIPIAGGGAALGFAVMAMLLLPSAHMQLGFRIAVFTAAAGAGSILLVWTLGVGFAGIAAFLRPSTATSGPAFAGLFASASMVAGALAMWLVRRLA